MKKEVYVINMSKKNIKGLISVLALSFLLAGCKEINATPGNYNDPLADELSHTINNTLANIYDKYKESGASKTQLVDDLLFAIAENQFGAYKDLAADSTIKEKVDTRALEKLYKKMNVSSYDVTTGEKRGNFDEHKFALKAVYGEGHHLVDEEGTPVEVNDLGSLTFFDTGVFLPHINEENFTEETHELVHIAYYTDYLTDAFLDETYRELLVEDYLLSEQSATLGRNYARKVTYVSINENSRYPDAVRRLFNVFIDDNILGNEGPADLEILASAWRGIKENFNDNEASLLQKAGLIIQEDDPSTPDVDEGEYQTLYGEILSDFNKIKDDPKTTDKTIENDFTNNGTRPAVQGLEEKVRKVAKTDLTKDGWAIKNGGLTELPEKIRTRVFNIGTSNGVDLVQDDQGVLADAGKIDPEISSTVNTFVRNINGTYYLVPKQYEKNDNRNFLFYEGSAYYIIQVEEAVNTSKLTEGNVREYSKLGKTEDEIAEIKDEIVRRLGALDSNRTAAIQHFIKKADLKFHDDAVKEYFYEKFPEIFDEDKK